MRIRDIIADALGAISLFATLYGLMLLGCGFGW